MTEDLTIDRSTARTSGDAIRSVRAALWVVLGGSIVFWIGLPWPVVVDYFEADDSAARVALIDDDRFEYGLAFGLLGLGALVAGVGLWMLGRAIAPMEARRSRRRVVAALIAAWLGFAGVLGGASRLLHAVFASPQFNEDTFIDPIVGGIAWIATGVALITFGVLAWSGPPPKWTAVVLVVGGVLGTVTFLPLFWYLATIIFASANLIVMRRSAHRRPE